MNIKVKIVAVCKNEAYFLPQWVYHHFYYGFDAIELYPNRITDNTLDVINKLQECYPNLSANNWGWFDSMHPESPTLQQSAYYYAYGNAKDSCDYILFMDCDEYWYPMDSVSNIHKIIEDMAYPDVLSFQWFNLKGRAATTVPIFSARYLRGYWNEHLKTMLRVNLKVTYIAPHMPFIRGTVTWKLGNGELFNQLDLRDGRLKLSEYKGGNSSIIIHDYQKSPDFFMAHFGRGRAISKQKETQTDYAVNRKPFNHVCQSDALSTLTLHIPNDYFLGLYFIYRQLNLWEDLRAAYRNILLEALEALRLCMVHPASELADIVSKSFGNIESIHTALITKLKNIYPEYSRLPAKPMLRPEDCTTTDHNETYENFVAHMALYPFAKDQFGQPLFLGRLFGYLVKNNLLDKAEEVLAEYADLPAPHIFRNWQLIILARGWEKLGRNDKAHALYNQLRYLDHPDAKAFLARYQTDSLISQ